MPLGNSLVGSLLKMGSTEYPVVMCGLAGAGKTMVASAWGLAAGAASAKTNDALFGITTYRIETPGFGRIVVRDMTGNKDAEGLVSNSTVQRNLQLVSGNASLVFVHDVSSYGVEESVLFLHRCVRLLYEHGGRGVWVVLSKRDLIVGEEERSHIVSVLKARFELELSKYENDFRWGVLDASNPPNPSLDKARDELKLLVEELRKSTPVRPSEWEARVGGSDRMSDPQMARLPEDVEVVRAADDNDAGEWWDAFLIGNIAPWTHRDYLRAAFLTLMRPLNRNKGILEVATDFARKMQAFKQRPVPFPQQPESRTITVFWIYHVRLAINSCQQQLKTPLSVQDFQTVLQHMPELLIEKLPTHYFSSDILRSKYSERYWILPDLHALTELPARPDKKLGTQVVLKQQGDPERVLRLAFAVVQRYLRGDSDRRRSWFIDLGFASLHRQTIRLRTLDSSVPPHSLTHAYFFLQMAHAALSRLSSNGFTQKMIQELSYHAFKDLFHITPTAWKEYYSPEKWYSLSARAMFMPPDLKPGLPTLTDGDYLPALEPGRIPDSARYKYLGLVPELPPTEILQFNLEILLEDAKVLPNPLALSDITTHPALLAYTVKNLTQPGPARGSPGNIDAHITQLSTCSPYSLSEVSFWTTQVLQAAHSTILPISPLSPNKYSISFRPPHWDPVTKKWIRYHNCPCHIDTEMEPHLGPSAVSYPHNFPYEHPPQLFHQCTCHSGEELDHDEFAMLCAESYKLREEWEKQSRGMRERPASLSKDPWENFMRFNPALAWEGLWGAGSGYEAEGWGEGGVSLERKAQHGNGGGTGGARSYGKEQSAHMADMMKSGEDQKKGDFEDGEREGEGHRNAADKTPRWSGETKVEQADEDDWEIIA